MAANLEKRRKLVGFIFVLPVVLYFAMIYYVPLVRSFDLSFKEILPKGKMHFAGLETYRAVLADPLFWDSVKHTALFTLLSAILVITLGLFIALGLHSLRKARNFFTIFFVLPTLISFVAAGTIWEWMLHSQFGLVNLALIALKLPTMRFLNSANQVIPSLAAINAWVRVGFAILIILAGLQSIPLSFFEAARVDGARGFKLLWYITLPLLLPQILVVSLLEVIFGFKVFDMVLVTTQGGPAGASYMILLYFYDNAFRFYRSDKAAVIAVIMFLTLLLFSILQRRIVKGRRYEI